MPIRTPRLRTHDTGGTGGLSSARPGGPARAPRQRRYPLLRGVPLHGTRVRRWLRAAIAAAVVLGIALVGSAFIGRPLQGYRINSLALDGPGRNECVAVYFVSDRSGSMGLFSVPRNAALRQELTWAQGHMRPQDRVGAIDFATTSAVLSTLTPARQVNPAIDVGIDVGQGTQFNSVLDLLADLPRHGCRTAVILLSDGAFADMPTDAAQAQQQLQQAGVDSLDLLVPSRLITVDDRFPQVFGVEHHAFNGLDANETSYVLAQAIARATGQALIEAG